jgi:anti-anti-sigma factor
MSASPEDSVFYDALDSVAFIHDRLSSADVLHVFGELDLANSDLFAAELGRAGRLGHPLAIDLTQCNYMDASALSVLVRARTALERDFVIAALPHGVPGRLLSLAEFDNCMTVSANIADALARLRRR